MKNKFNLAGVLVQQYLRHKSLIIAVDFDDTVYDFSGKGNFDFEYIHDLLRRCKKLGFTLICFTCREDKTFPMQFSKDNGFEFDYFNESPVSGEGWGGNGAKPYFNIMLDDKMGLEYTAIVLNDFVSKVESYGIREEGK